MVYYIIGILLLFVIIFLGYRSYTLQAKLNKKNEELNTLVSTTEKKVELYKKLISSLSQELRTPLYGIMGLTNLLVNEHPEIANNKNLKSLKFSGDYLLTLINNVLQVNIMDSEELSLDQKPFNLKELTQNVTNSFSYATENSDNTLMYNFDDDIPSILHGNPAMLSQILMNLISNALKFTRNGNIVFSIQLIHTKGTTSQVSFKITHDGNEVTKEDEKSIYREFIGVNKAKNTYLGTGLNAAIVKRLAKYLNGEIILQNNLSGSEYAFIVAMEAADTEIEKDTLKPIENNKPRILVVDDNKLNLLVADKILTKENFECTTVDNGFDAIDLTRDNSYHIILMDINMPKLNGIGATKRIREFDTKTPIIALTGVDVTQLNRQIMRAGLNDYILKPYDKNALLEMIHKHIRQYS